jgi:hypothetical protein
LIAAILLLAVGRRLLLLITALLVAALLTTVRIIWIGRWIGRRGIAWVLALLIRVLALIRIPTHDKILPFLRD